ncbi:hybrid signal transduction histidine kinase M, partial [Tanacetum coccineum]
AMDEEISRLKTTAVGLLSDLGCNGSTLTEDLINEMCRYGAAELHAVAAYVGGVASQEIIKLSIVYISLGYCGERVDETETGAVEETVGRRIFLNKAGKQQMDEVARLSSLSCMVFLANTHLHPLPSPWLKKFYAVHNINSLIPEKLDLAESNYSTWSYFFKGHCSNFGVLKHIEEPVTEASTSTPPTDEWIMVDSIVKSSIFLTLSSTLRKRLIKANPKTAKAAWDAIETIFQENKRTRNISLKGELRVIQMGDQTADEYFSKIEAILTFLTDLGNLPRNSNNLQLMASTGDYYLSYGSQSGGLNVSQQQQLLQLLQAQQTMLAQFGFNGLSGQSRPTNITGFRSGQLAERQQAFQPTTTGISRDPTDANWNMDTGASSHLNSNATNLSTLFNSCMYPSVLVGDGKSIPVTNTGHSTLPTPYKPSSPK